MGEETLSTGNAIRTAPLILVVLAVMGAAAVAVAQSRESSPVEYWRDPGASDASRGLQELAASLNSRERALTRREQAHEQKAADLTKAETRLDERLEELRALRAEIQVLLQDMDADREKRIFGLVKAIENMRSKQAAAVLERTEVDLAVAVLDKMSKMKSGRALAAMDPAKAASLAEKLAMPLVIGGTP